VAKKPAPKKPAKLDLLAELVQRAQSGEAPLTEAEINGEAAPEPLGVSVREPVLEPETIPRPGDPGFTTAVIVALVDCQGDVAATLKRMHCTFADYLAVSSTTEFKTALNNIINAKVDIPNRLAVRLALTEEAKQGNAYTAKVLHDTRQGETITEEEQRALAELRMADRRTLGRQLEQAARKIVGMLEVVRGRRYTLIEADLDGNEPAVAIEPTVADIAADISQPYEDPGESEPESNSV
jgi:hypothetical protein